MLAFDRALTLEDFSQIEFRDSREASEDEKNEFGKQPTNRWIAHVQAYRSSHPGMTYSEALKRATTTYRGLFGGRYKEGCKGEGLMVRDEKGNMVFKEETELKHKLVFQALKVSDNSWKGPQLRKFTFLAPNTNLNAIGILKFEENGTCKGKLYAQNTKPLHDMMTQETVPNPDDTGTVPEAPKSFFITPMNWNDGWQRYEKSRETPLEILTQGVTILEPE